MDLIGSIMSLGPTRSVVNDSFGGEASNKLASLSFLWSTMLYNAGYYSRSMTSPSHLSFQNLISEPFLFEKEPYEKNNFFVAIRPT
jgi:hypothetical protein